MAYSTFSQPHIRAGIHYIVATALFTFYGMRVSPFLDAIPFLTLFFQTAIVFLVLYLIRLTFYLGGSKSSALTDITLFTLTAIFFAGWHQLFYHFPLQSNLKVAFGIILIGSFITIDLAISNARAEQDKPSSFTNTPTAFVPFAVQVGFAIIYLIFTLTMLLSLIMSRDLLWISQHDMLALNVSDVNNLVKMFLFITLIVSGYIIVIARNAAALIQRQLAYQAQALDNVSERNFDNRVPMNTIGEFSIIAYYTNNMLEDLATSGDVDSEHKSTHSEVRTSLSLQQHENTNTVILNIASLIASRDASRAHLLRIQRYAKTLALTMANHPAFKDSLDDETIELFYKCAPVYDIGKIAIPDAILKKPSKLTENEFAIMKSHVQIGTEILNIEGEDNEFFTMAKEIAISHHECWDGTGYPNGLAGENIPLLGRIMALADSYDSLISKRFHREAYSHDVAKEKILAKNGTQFDPAVIDAFIKAEDKFIDISNRYRDDLLYTIVK